MATRQRLVTAEKLLAMPRGTMRRELIRGEIRERSLAGWRAGLVAAHLHRSLSDAVEARGLGIARGPVGYQLERDPDTVRAPSASFVSHQRLSRMGEDDDGYFPGAPTVAVEVLSFNDTRESLHDTVRDWLRFGTDLIAVADPERSVVTVYRPGGDVTELTEDDVLDGGDVVPGWTCPVRDLFARPTAAS